jgi:hypothetical protein
MGDSWFLAGIRDEDPPEPQPRRRGLLFKAGVVAAGCLGLWLLTVLVSALAGRSDPPPPPLHIPLGDPAPEFVLKDLDGQEFRSRDLLHVRPLVLEFGNFT